MNWLNTIKTLAPVVASAIGGPLSGSIVTALGGIFGIAEPTQDKLKAAIETGQMTGEQISRIRELEITLKAEESERGFKYANLEVQDRENARHRDTEIVKAVGHNYRADAMFVLAVAVIVGLVYAIWSEPGINEFMKGIVTLVLGRFLGYLDNIYNFEYGTTRSSKDKDVTINQLSAK